MNINENCKLVAQNGKIFDEKDGGNRLIDYSISLGVKYPVIIVHDYNLTMLYNIFFSDFVLELRKTILNEKLWCEKDSENFNNYQSHFNTINSLTDCKCVVLLFMDLVSLRKKSFLDCIKMLKWRLENKSSLFSLISIVNVNVKTHIEKFKKIVDEDIFRFISLKILDSALVVDFQKDPKNSVMYSVSNSIPSIVSSLYSPSELASIDLDEFYQLKNMKEEIIKSFSTKRMHLWTCSDLACWLETKNYSPKLIDDIENKRINGFVFQNVSPDDLHDVLKITSPLLRQKIIDDVCVLLQEQDVKNNDWQFAYRLNKPKSKHVIIINDFSDQKDVERLTSSNKVNHGFTFQFDNVVPKSRESEEMSGWKNEAFEIGKAKIVVVYVSSKILMKDGKSFITDVEKKIIFSRWLRRTIVFIITDHRFNRLNQAFKILIDDQPILNACSKDLETISRPLFGLLDLINNQPNLNFKRLKIPTVTTFEFDFHISNFISPETFEKRKIVLHYHTECQSKVDKLKIILENGNFIVNTVSVDQKDNYFISVFGIDETVREETLVNSNVVVLCLSPRYIQNNQTKTDLKLLCQLLQKNTVLVLLQKLHDLKLLPKIQSLLFRSGAPNLKSKTMKNNATPKIDLSMDINFNPQLISDLLFEVEKFK